MKITLENTRKHDINLCVATKEDIKRVSIPAARAEGPQQKLVNGRAECDGDLVAQARKNSKVVQHYFSEGWLKEVKESKIA